MSLRNGIIALAFVSCAPRIALAQESTPIRVEDVYVRGTDGVELRGQLVDFGPATVSLFVEGVRRELPIDDIERIQRRGDSVRNGALIGAGLAAILSAIAIADVGSDVVPFAIGATIGYGLLGAGIDALIPGKTTIYAKPARAPSLPVARRAGLSVKIGF